MGKKITVIGAGPGGYVAAVRAAQLGGDVTVIEKDNVGGTCLNQGCIPSKVMIKTAQLLGEFQRASEFGIHVAGTISPDIGRLMARKEKIIQSQAQGILGLLNHHKVEYLTGNGIIRGKHRITVDQADGTTRDVPWDKLIIATGSRPMEIPSFPFDGRRILSSDHILNLESIPESILIVGGGVIGCEFAGILSALGTKVTIVEALQRLLPLPSVDEDCSKVLSREMKKNKIRIMVNKTVDRFEKAGKGLKVSVMPSPFAEKLKEKEKTPVIVEVKKILLCIGRKPNTADMGIERLGVKMNSHGWIDADERMETAAPDVHAIGDVLGPEKVMLAHVASAEGLVAAENAMGGNRVMDYRAVPGAVYTLPEVADVGLTESQAREMKIGARSDSILFRSIGKSHVIGEISGQAKIVSDKESGRVLGVHIIGPHATDLIAEGTLAVQLGVTVQDLAATIHAHPTLSEIMVETALKATEKALHG